MQHHGMRQGRAKRNQGSPALEPEVLPVLHSISLGRKNILASILLFIIYLLQGHNLVHGEWPD